MKIKIIAFVSLLLFAGCSFSKQPQAFLDTKFGMSVNEVEGVTGKKLLTNDEYASDTRNPKIFSGFMPIGFFPGSSFNPNDKEYTDRSKDLFMSRIMLYDFPAGVHFNFFDNKLNNVAVHFGVNFGNLDILINKIKENLEKSYKFIKKEDSKNVSGAYTLKYEKEDVNVDLWVNTSNEDKVLIIYMHYLPLNEAYQEDHKKREQNAL